MCNKSSKQTEGSSTKKILTKPRNETPQRDNFFQTSHLANKKKSIF